MPKGPCILARRGGRSARLIRLLPCSQKKVYSHSLMLFQLMGRDLEVYSARFDGQRYGTREAVDSDELSNR